MRQDAAETIALKALAWIIGNDDLMAVFLGASGATPEDMKLRANDAEFLVSVLDFLCMDDAWIMEFCNSADLPADAPFLALRSLPGGREVHWT